MKLCNSSHWFSFLIFLTDLCVWRSWVQEILQEGLNTSHTTAPEWRNNKRPFSTHPLCRVFPFPSPHNTSPAAATQPRCKQGLIHYVTVLPWMNKIPLPNAKILSFVPSPTEVSQYKRLQKLFCMSRTSIFFAQALKWKLNFITQVFILRNSFSVYLILCKIMGKPKMNEIIQTGTRLKREVLSLFCPKSLTHFMYYTCLTNTCCIKTNPSLFLLTKL